MDPISLILGVLVSFAGAMLAIFYAGKSLRSRELSVQIGGQTLELGDTEGANESFGSSKLEDIIESQYGKLHENPIYILIQSRDRLKAESIRIRENSKLNLIIGVGFSTFGIILLGVLIVVLPYVDGDDTTFTIQLSEILPRLSVSILVQFVGFFFLRLYVSSENDLKSNKNEITNIELKISGLVFCMNDKTGHPTEISMRLLNEERNFVIKKSERTVSAEQQARFNDFTEILKSLAKKIPGSDKN